MFQYCNWKKLFSFYALGQKVTVSFRTLQEINLGIKGPHDI